MLDECESLAKGEVGGLQGIKEDAFLPPVALFDEVVHVEWRLFLDVGLDPLYGLAVFVVPEADTPVFPDGALEADVEA